MHMHRHLMARGRKLWMLLLAGLLGWLMGQLTRSAPPEHGGVGLAIVVGLVSFSVLVGLSSAASP